MYLRHNVLPIDDLPATIYSVIMNNVSSQILLLAHFL